MVDRIRRNELSKKWRLDNPEKWKVINDRNLKQWRTNNPDKYKGQYMLYNKKRKLKKTEAID